MSQGFAELPDLSKQLVELIRQIPAGRVATYGTLAQALGNGIAARWVAQFVAAHEHDTRCPCHRVVAADGRVGPYVAGGSSQKVRRLRREGVEIREDMVKVAQHGFDQFQSERPLEKLRRVQEELVEKVSLRGPRKLPGVVGGVDVSYPASDEGVAAYALVDLQSGRLLWSTAVRRRVRFPYITSYLAFREIPILLELLDAVRAGRRLAELLLVDGSGILHHRHAGIATHLGVITGLRTVGVTKTLLLGRVDLAGMEPGESRLVSHEQQAIGVAVRATARSRRPIFISPGHRVNLSMSEAVVRRLLVGRRLPEPLYWADRLSRAEGQK